MRCTPLMYSRGDSGGRTADSTVQEPQRRGWILKNSIRCGRGDVVNAAYHGSTSA